MSCGVGNFWRLSRIVAGDAWWGQFVHSKGFRDAQSALGRGLPNRVAGGGSGRTTAQQTRRMMGGRGTAAWGLRRRCPATIHHPSPRACFLSCHRGVDWRGGGSRTSGPRTSGGNGGVGRPFPYCGGSLTRSTQHHSAQGMEGSPPSHLGPHTLVPPRRVLTHLLWRRRKHRTVKSEWLGKMGQGCWGRRHPATGCAFEQMNIFLKVKTPGSKPK